MRPACAATGSDQRADRRTPRSSTSSGRMRRCATPLALAGPTGSSPITATDAHVYGLEAAGTVRADQGLVRARLARAHALPARSVSRSPTATPAAGATWRTPRTTATRSARAMAPPSGSLRQRRARRPRPAIRLEQPERGAPRVPCGQRQRSATPGTGWTFTLWAKNLLNEAYDKRVYFFGNAEPDFIATRYEDRADPRQLGATAAYRF